MVFAGIMLIFAVGVGIELLVFRPLENSVLPRARTDRLVPLTPGHGWPLGRRGAGVLPAAPYCWSVVRFLPFLISLVLSVYALFSLRPDTR